MRLIFFVLALLSGFSATAMDRPWLQSQSSAAREAKRFTLMEWLEGKDRRTMSDMWLAMHTPSPYEIILGGSFYQYSLNDTTGGVAAAEEKKSSYEGEFSAYARFMGVTGIYANNTQEKYNDVIGMFNLRLFGVTNQGSHLTFHYGLRTRTAADGSYRLNQQFPAVTLNLYLMKYFGLEGHYRYYMPYSEDFYGSTNGDELQAGLYIEYGVLRIFGLWYVERQHSDKAGTIEDIRREGSKAGLKIFF